MNTLRKQILSTITYKCQLQSNLSLQPPADISQGMMGWFRVESQRLRPRVGVKIRDQRQKLLTSVSNFVKKKTKNNLRAVGSRDAVVGRS